MKKFPSIPKLKFDFAKNKKLIIGIGIIVILGAIITSYISSGIPVDSAYVSEGTVTKLVSESGTVESRSAVMLTAKQTGEIMGILVEEGDSVKEGDPLVTGDGTSANFDIKSLEAELRGLQAQYSQAADLARKSKILYNQGAISSLEYQETQTMANQLSAQVDALRYSIASYANSSGGAGLVAPIDGIITGIFAKEGESIMMGQPLIEISNLEDIYIAADLIVGDADLVEAGNQVRIFDKDSGIDDNNGKVVKVHLKAQDYLSDLGITQKRVRVEIQLSQEKTPRLGSNVDVEITVDQKMNVLRVPDTSIFEVNGISHVYVIENRKAKLREVSVGLEGEDFVEILTGLELKDEVILSPGNDIENNVRIKPTQVTQSAS
jgi:HlyD family secretion protein